MENANEYTNKGLEKLKLGYYRGALEDFDQAIKINPNDAGAYCNRGIARHKIGDYSVVSRVVATLGPDVGRLEFCDVLTRQSDGAFDRVVGVRIVI